MPLSAKTTPAILALDSSAESCSVALGRAGATWFRVEPQARRHAAVLLPMVDAVLADAGCALSALDLIAVNCGPGSFTGLRIGVAAAQGLAIGAVLPVLPVSALKALAFAAQRKYPGHKGPVLTAIDARMHEVYVAWWDFSARVPCGLDAQQVCAPTGVAPPAGYQWHDTLAVGNGANIVVDALGVRDIGAVDGAIAHSAMDILELAVLGDDADGVIEAGALEPVYLRDKVTG